MNQQKLIVQLKKQINAKLKKCSSPTELFIKLKSFAFSRVDLMIIDSSIKNMPMENLDKTLLLLKESYLNQLFELTNRLKNIKI